MRRLFPTSFSTRRSDSSGVNGQGQDDTPMHGTSAAQGDRHFLELFQSLPIACIKLDRKGVITDWNRAASELYGWSASEVIGRNLSETILRPEDSNRFREQIELVFSGKSFQEQEWQQRREGDKACAVSSD